MGLGTKTHETWKTTWGLFIYRYLKAEKSHFNYLDFLTLQSKPPLFIKTNIWREEIAKFQAAPELNVSPTHTDYKKKAKYKRGNPLGKNLH